MSSVWGQNLPFFPLLSYVQRDVVHPIIKMNNFYFLTGCIYENVTSIPEPGIQSLLWQWNPDHRSCSPSSFLHTEFILISISSQSSLQQRHCAYHVTSKKSKFTTAGNVSGSVQLCKNTECCVGYYVVISGQPEVDVLGEETQPGTTGLDWKGVYAHGWRLCLLVFLLQLVIKWRSIVQIRPARPRGPWMVAPLSVCATQTCATATSPGAQTHMKNMNNTPPQIIKVSCLICGLCSACARDKFSLESYLKFEILNIK